ncbi:MAG: hypothetical protein ABSC91_04975 [Candidatus Bathyarchaeia archaeon]
MAEVLIEVIAKNPPSILFVLAFILLGWGYTTNDGNIVSAGWIFFVAGVVLQILWLVFTKG